MSQRTQKAINIIILILATIGALMVSLKMLFTGFSADEEFQMVLGYRLATGDHFLVDVWDAIQTSGFLVEWLTKIYLAIFGTTEGMLLYLRAAGLFIQFIVAIVLFLTVKEALGSKKAYLFSIFFYCIFTKLIALPDFSNMQMWFMTLMLCFIWKSVKHYKESSEIKAYVYLSLAAIMYCGAVLSTACVIVIPVIVIMLTKVYKGHPVKVNLIFFGVCALVGCLYIVRIAIDAGSISNVIINVSNMFAGDSTHLSQENIVGNSKILTDLINLLKVILYMGVTALVAYLISLVACKKNNSRLLIWGGIWITLSILVALFNWFVLDTGYDGMKLYIPVTAVCGLICYLMKDNQSEATECSLAPFWGIIINLVAMIGIQGFSNVPFVNNLQFLSNAMLWGVFTIILMLERRGKQLQGVIALVSMCLVSMIGSGYCLSSGPIGTNVLDLDGIIRNGPARNCIVSRDVAWIYHTDYLEFESIVPKDSNVLIVTDYFRNTSVTSCYMLNNVGISHYSVNSTPTYSEHLYEYWRLHPEKLPNVVMVNKNVVTLSEDKWITGYILDEFGYNDVIETENATYYFK